MFVTLYKYIYYNSLCILILCVCAHMQSSCIIHVHYIIRIPKGVLYSTGCYKVGLLNLTAMALISLM